MYKYFVHRGRREPERHLGSGGKRPTRQLHMAPSLNPTLESVRWPGTLEGIEVAGSRRICCGSPDRINDVHGSSHTKTVYGKTDSGSLTCGQLSISKVLHVVYWASILQYFDPQRTILSTGYMRDYLALPEASLVAPRKVPDPRRPRFLTHRGPS